MPRYDYKCIECEKVFEAIHGMNEKLDKCEKCGSKNIKKLFNHITFKVIDGTSKSDSYGYSGRYPELVKKMKGNKEYRDGYRKELEQQTKKGLSDFKSDKEMNKASETFNKMKKEGEKMSKYEKEKIKEEFGIKKGMKIGNIGL